MLRWNRQAANVYPVLPLKTIDRSAREIAVIRTVASLRDVLSRERAKGKRIALVPTMGALHQGHLSLIRQARAECEVVVMSLFVNPTQFNEQRDLDAYPRTEEADVLLAADAGCDIVFAPSTSEVYRNGFNTTIDVGAIARPLEGEARGAVHFRGVATVVAKLFNMVAPHVAYFGQKDAQQTLVVRQLVRDLDFPVDIRICPTVREADGLAMSSRNARLSKDARAQALALIDALRAIDRAITDGERDASTLVQLGTMRLHAFGIERRDIDYVAIVDAETLVPVGTIEGTALVAIAAFVGGIRLIDNILVTK